MDGRFLFRHDLDAAEEDGPPLSSEHFHSFEEYRFPWPWSDLRRWPPEQGSGKVS